MKFLKMKAVLRVAVVPLVFSFAGAVSAATVTMTDYAGRKSPGGPFVADNIIGGPLSGGGSFITFCLELNEYIKLGNNYEYQLSTEVIDRGTGSPIKLQSDTAYLYSKFRSGALTTTFDYNDAADLNQLQLAIYKTEGILSGSDYTLKDLGVALVAEAKAAGWTGIGNVRVMNLNSPGCDNDPWCNQDQLAIVPIPAAAWLFGSGLIGLAIARRKKSA